MFIPRRFAPPLSKGDGCRTIYLPPCCQPCRYLMQTKTSNRDLPFSKGPGVCRRHAHHAVSHAAIDADKDPQPRPPLFKRGRGYAEDMPTKLQAMPQPMRTKTRDCDLPFSKRPGVCRSPAHHAAIQAATDADKDPQPRPPLFKGAGGMQKTCPPHCQPCCNRCRQRPATATSPYPHNPVSVVWRKL